MTTKFGKPINGAVAVNDSLVREGDVFTIETDAPNYHVIKKLEKLGIVYLADTIEEVENYKFMPLAEKARLTFTGPGDPPCEKPLVDLTSGNPILANLPDLNTVKEEKVIEKKKEEVKVPVDDKKDVKDPLGSDKDKKDLKDEVKK